MKKNYSTVLSLILVIATVMGLSACGTDVSSDSNVTQLTVAVCNNSKPNSYTDDNGVLVGYEVEIIQAIDEKLDEYEFTIEAVSQDAEEIGIDTGKYALIAQGFYKTEERAAKYLIPDENTGVSLMKIYTLESETINSMEDLGGKTLAPVPPNGGIYNFITAYNEEHPDSQVEFDTAENVAIATRFSELVDGKYDAIIWPSANLDLSEIEKSLKVTFRASDPVSVNPTYFLIAPDQEAFYEKVNKAITELKEDGTISEISKKYFGEDILQYYSE